ncbi:hypothetical protein DICPUDRAFT_86320 [Dictyostelium purpureum]|uniref:NAD-dependent epimerase/dehydratase domain-containing protein n=1 Tax=Dictyostelium purpureum TaxID=5786 RepID=F0ZAX8_DICPU|nr:uncharacterized protein DICPUDRAFT_86320 [Dictyostelium purpureum]EGC38877.1 hypothetical protein DICPUDRAFT_86320 [Dictyostelium purpureum]|eukprot:XP_003284557.1 hypothetical protein DICPUDRAFT_86320 [Dictyostelium purpureum]
MTSILVLGVGYIGLNVSKKLKANGYKVYGISILEKDKIKMIRNEIIPIIADIHDCETWIPKTCELQIDVVIECISSKDKHSPRIIQESLIKLQQLLPKIKIIHTSGSFSFGSNDFVMDEKTRRYDHSDFKWIEEIDNNYVDMGAIVIIPSMIYGKNGSYTHFYYHCVELSKEYNKKEDKKHVIKIYGNKNNVGFYSGFIHINDLSDFYLLVVEKSSQIRGETFIANSYSIKVEDLIREIAKFSIEDISKKEIEIEYVDLPQNKSSFLLAMTFNQRLSHSKASTILGFHPKQPSLIDACNIYYLSWKYGNATTKDFISSIVSFK